jgi:zinc protease
MEAFLRAAQLGAFAMTFCAATLAVRADDAAMPRLAVQSFRLANGLRVIFHPDRTSPIVHIEVWYDAGAKDEEPGRRGLAHLFEHMMFQGTKHIPEDAFVKYLDAAGASHRNGATTHDYTKFYETLPSNKLELGLWLESSRMGFLLDRPGIKASFVSQRSVVQNEWRQRVDNVPGGNVVEIEAAALYPPDHPYHHSVNGSRLDIEATSLKDITAFYRRYYTPDNAILLVAGDFEPAAARHHVSRYFGAIAPGPGRVAAAVPAADLKEEKRVTVEAGVSFRRVTYAWHTPPLFAAGDAEMDVLVSLLGHRTSRLYRRLFDEQRAAQDLSVENSGRRYGNVIKIVVTATPGASLETVGRTVHEEVERLRTHAVTDSELRRVRNRYRGELLRSLESLQKRAGRILTYAYHTGTPDFISTDLTRYLELTPEMVRAAAHRFLSPRARVVLTTVPAPGVPIAGRLAQ